MEGLLQIDFRSIFVPSLHLAEVVLRGTLVYLFLFHHSPGASTGGRRDKHCRSAYGRARCRCGAERDGQRIQIDHGRCSAYWHDCFMGLFFWIGLAISLHGFIGW